MSDVFISHSSKDKDIADTVVNFLEDKGLSCWITPRDSWTTLQIWRGVFVRIFQEAYYVDN